MVEFNGRRRRPKSPRRAAWPVLERLEDRVVMSTLGYVVDDGDPGYAEAGKNWRTVWGTAGHLGSARQHDRAAANGPASVRWALADLPAGSYEVFATWVPDPTWRATNAPYTVFDGPNAQGTVRVDQRLAPDDLNVDGHRWKSLGTYAIASGTLVVQLSNDADGRIVADAVRVVPADPLRITVEGPYISDEGDWVQLLASASGGAGPLEYAWDFYDDGAFETLGPDPAHRFLDDGEYPVHVRVIDSKGAIAVASTLVVVANVAPTASIEGSHSATVRQPVVIRGLATDPSPIDAAAGFHYEWDFGDGTPVVSGPELTAPSHAYSRSGTYTVRLAVTDKDGATSQVATATVAVYGPDPAPPTPPLSTSPSPTGREPRLLWTARQQAVWHRMRDENHPWWQLIRDHANRTDTPTETWGDHGQWATLAYQITGDVAYAIKAWNRISRRIAEPPANRNTTRQFFADYVVYYDWLYPALTPAQRTTYYETLNTWADLVLDRGDRPWGTRLGDSDEVVGHYFGLALLDLATAPDNPRAGSFLATTWQNLGVTKPVGGLGSTGANRDTMRNAISDYVRMAEGGQWIESSQYNLNTLQHLLVGAQAIRTATGVDHFPEVTRLASQLARGQIYELTPDLRQSYQWGDVERARNIQIPRRMSLLTMLAGLTQDDGEVGPHINQLVHDFTVQYGFRGWLSAQPEAQGLFFYNPYAAHADWRADLPRGHFASGMGLLHFQDGWGANDSLFGAQMTPRLRVDHEVNHFGNFQLYRRGEWAITNPIGYGGPAIQGEGANAMLIAGLSSMQETRHVVAQEFGPGGAYAYLAGTTRGQAYEQPYWNPPPTYLHEWTRSVFYLPSSNKASDTILVYDRVNAENPRELPRFDRYRKVDQERINDAPALKQWIIHAPVAPTVTEAGLAWQTPGGQQVRVSTLLPFGQSRVVIDESELWAGRWNFHASEKQWQVRIMPDQQRQWDTFLNVVQVSDPGTALTNAAVHSAGGEAEGALIRRGGQPDALVLFGARPEGRLLSEGYSVHWNGNSAETDAFLLDLDPSRNWAIRINGSAAIPFTVSAQGVGHIKIDGPGIQRLELVAL